MAVRVNVCRSSNTTGRQHALSAVDNQDANFSTPNGHFITADTQALYNEAFDFAYIRRATSNILWGKGSISPGPDHTPSPPLAPPIWYHSDCSAFRVFQYTTRKKKKMVISGRWTAGDTAIVLGTFLYHVFLTPVLCAPLWHRNLISIVTLHHPNMNQSTPSVTCESLPRLMTCASIPSPC